MEDFTVRGAEGKTKAKVSHMWKEERTELLGAEVAVTAMKEAYRESCWDWA